MEFFVSYFVTILIGCFTGVVHPFINSPVSYGLLSQKQKVIEIWTDKKVLAGIL